MPWISVSLPNTDAAVAEALAASTADYPAEYRPEGLSKSRLPQAVREDSIVLAHSLIPRVLRHVFAAYGALLDPALPLTRRQHELIAATVSTLNRCFY